ncbi:uncharacterized protein [Solanum lycopersicum]|uniref:uncharacterized protein n=1 Tax=Solanum lycopersicum TaxID=4081 RepID=UPI003749D205
MATIYNELPEKLSHNHPLFLHSIDNSCVLLSSIQLTGADNFSELLGGIVYSTNAAAVWKDLCERYDKIDGSRIFQLHKEIATISQGTNSISSYFSKLRELWVEYDSLAPVPGCECVNSREFVVFMHNQKLLQFLMGLNDSYEQARSQILMMVPLPTVIRPTHY